MSDKFVTIFSHLQIFGIELAKSILEENNIMAMVKGYDTTRPYLSFITLIELQVAEKDKELAESLIADIKEEFK
jgi:Putative prokaryotic signal transducing protein